MTLKSDKILSIAELLPEGLTESAILEIAELVDTVIAEQVAERVQDLEIKVKGFMRLKVDELKEQALVELQESEQFVRNAKLFESVKTLMALELSIDDEDSAIAELVQEQDSYAIELEFLTEELSKSFEDNEDLCLVLKTLTDKIEILEGKNKSLTESVQVFEDAEDKPFKSSEKGIVIAENVDKTPEKSFTTMNEFLTPEVMEYMPSNQNSQ